QRVFSSGDAAIGGLTAAGATLAATGRAEAEAEALPGPGMAASDRSQAAKHKAKARTGQHVV
ncbi:MAG TPA: hypothetical protein VEX18_18545, partial [Polyangiaceae bacterium]|nr:hypothetical protein [Polyangiaceae bacterium]